MTDPNVTSTDPFEAFSSEEQEPDFLAALAVEAEKDRVTEATGALGDRLSESQARITALAAAVGESDTRGSDVSDIVQGIQRSYERLNEVVRTDGGEEAIRMRAAHNEQRSALERSIETVQELTNDVDEIDPDGSIADGARSIFNRTMDERAEDRASFALEEAFHNSMADLALTDPDLANLHIRQSEVGNELGLITDLQTRRMILQREIERAGVELEGDRNWLFYGLDMIHRAIPFIESTAQTGNVEGTGNGFMDWLFPEGQIRREAQVLNDPRIPLDEYQAAARGMVSSAVASATDFGYTDVWQAMDIMRFRQNADLAEGSNVFALFDNVIPFYGTARSLVRIPTQLAARGARTVAAEINAELVMRLADKPGSIDDILGLPTQPSNRSQLMGSTVGSSIDNIVADSLPDAVNPGVLNGGSGTQGLVLRNVERGQALLQRVLGDMTPTQRLLVNSAEGVDEVGVAAERQAAMMAERLDRDIALNINARAIDVETSTGTHGYRLEITVGTKKGGKFATQAAATRYATSMGLDPDNVTYVRGQGTGGWTLTVNTDVSEVGAMVTGLNSRIPSGPFGAIRGFLSGARGILDENLMGSAFIAGNQRSAIISAMQEMATPLKKLSGQQLQDLDVVHQLGRDGYLNDHRIGIGRGSQWFTDSELDRVYNQQFGRSVTPNERIAYHANRNIVDMEYTLRNDVEYMELFSRGFEEVAYEPLFSGRNGRISTSVKGIGGESVYNPITNTFVTPETIARQLEAGTHVFVELTESITVGEARITRLLVAKSDITTRPLSRVQLPYHAGGHRMYEGSYFGKQARFSDDGHGMSPSTYMVGKSKAEVGIWTRVMNDAREAAIRGADADELDSILVGRGYPSGQEFLDGVKSKLYNLDDEFEAVFDREVPAAYTRRNPSNLSEMESELRSGVSELYQTRGDMYYGRRGTGLRDLNGDRAATLNIYETIDRSIQNISSAAAFSDFKAQAINRWVRTYAGDINRNDFRNATPNSRIFSDAIITSTNPDVRHAAKAQRDVIQRILNWKKPSDLHGEQMMRNFAEWVGDTNLPGAIKASNWLSTHSLTPVSWLRGAAFNLKLGLFNIGQFPLQISTIIATTTIDPVHGLQGMKALPFVRQFFSTNVDDLETAFTAMISRNIHKEIGFADVAEFRAYMMDARLAGNLDVSMSSISEVGRQAAVRGEGLGARGAVDAVVKAGQYPFLEAERWNRIVGRHIAWQRVRKALPDLDYNSPEFHNRFATMRDDFSLNMTRESQAAWQQGILGLPTQFWSYQARMLELMGSKRITHSERARLMLGQLFFFGSSGVAGGSIVSAMMTDANEGQVGELNTLRGVFDRGLLDHVLWNAFEADVKVGGRLAVGDFIEDRVRDIMGLSQYGEQSLFDLATGATGGITVETMTDFGALMYAAATEAGAMSSEGGMPITQRSLHNFLSNASSYSNGLKAYIAWNYGTYVTNTGNTITEDITPVEAVFQAFSFTPGSLDATYARLNWMRNRSGAIDELAGHRSQLWTRYINEPRNRDDILTEIDHFTQLAVDVGLWKEVNDRTRIQSSVARSIELQAARQGN